MRGDQPSEKELLEIQARRTRAEQLRDYLAYQVEFKATQKAAREEQERRFADHQQASYQAWEAREAEKKHEAAARAAEYRAALDTQLQNDRTRKLQATQYSRLGPVTTKAGTDDDLPYDLYEMPVLSTLGTTIRYQVVQKDGTAMPRPKRLF